MTTLGTLNRTVRTVRGGPGRRPGAPESTDRSSSWRVQLTVALLVLNVLTFYDMQQLVPIPSVAGKLLTQAALIGALLMALSVNRPAAIRRNVTLALLTVLVAEALMTCVRSEFLLGATFRAGRFAVFVAVLWLLTPWWGRRDLLVIRCYLRVIWVVLGSVCLGLVLAPGLALANDRLAGVIWPVPPTQVGHYAAIAGGLAIVLWLSGLLRRELALLAVVIAAPVLILTHTRTATIAMLAGVLIAGLSLFTTRARVRKAFAIGAVVASVAALTVSSLITTWLARGQNTTEVADLTGRTKVWDALLAQSRSPFETIFGFGLSNKSFNGLPIDSSWLAAYYDLGLFGVAIAAALVAFLLVAAAFRPRGPQRALALFLIAYCLVASFTETGLSDASTYFIELSIAASLLIPPPRPPVLP